MKPTPPQREGLLENLVATRQGARISKARVARWAGVSRMTIGRMEIGAQAITADVLRAYAALCGLDANQLLLSWGIVPDEVLIRLQQNPQLVALILGS